MVRLPALIAALLLIALRGNSVPPKKKLVAWPAQFEIGNVTHFDFGPPFSYYELFIVRPADDGSSIQRITLTPAADRCLRTAKTEVAVGKVSASVQALLGVENPCSIPEKKLRQEVKRCKHCLVFSFATTTVRVQCGAQARLIRAEVLDRDMFAANPHTPKYTSWTMDLLKQLEEAVGPGVMSKPMIELPEKQSSTAQLDPVVARGLAEGQYDPLFIGASEKASEIYRSSLKPAPVPTVELVSSKPLSPIQFVAPSFSPIAELVHAEGDISIRIGTDNDGNVLSVALDAGSPLLFGPARAAATQWKFPPNPGLAEILAKLRFSLNCPPQSQNQAAAK